MNLKSDADKAGHTTQMEKPTDSTEIGRRKRVMQIAKAINAIEGAPTSEYADELARRWAKGELTGEQMKLLLSEYHRKIAVFTKERNEE